MLFGEATFGEMASNPFAHFAHPTSSMASTARSRPQARVDCEPWHGLADELLHQVIFELLATEYRGKEGFARTRALRRVYALSALSKATRRACRRALADVLALSRDQVRAFVMAMSGRNVFLTGGAGVGKSHTLRLVVDHLPPATTAVTASTGCAAALIGATTMHSYLGLGLGNADVKTLVNIIRKRAERGNSDVLRRVSVMQTLVVDEVGMIDAELLDKAAEVVGVLRGSPSVWNNLQLICCGDFLQLAPPEAARKGWAFESRLWKHLRMHRCILHTVHRQQDDVTFATVLARVRRGEATHADLAYLQRESASEVPEGALQLFARNKDADALNQKKFHELTVENNAVFCGLNAIDSGDENALKNCAAATRLSLCEGARCMCVRNIEAQIVNGSLGTVNKLVRYDGPPSADTPDGKRWTITVRFDGVMGGDPVDYTFQSMPCCRIPAADAVYKFSVMDGKREVASRYQVPLRLAWGASMHKSQGMSLEKVSIDFNGCFAGGQAYTALARCKRLSSAYLRGLQLRHLRMVESKALEWYDRRDKGAAQPP